MFSRLSTWKAKILTTTAGNGGHASEHLRPDIEQAERFLSALDPIETEFCFQTFDDDRDRRDRTLARTHHGSLDALAPVLTRFNRHGAGVFISVNEIKDGAPRKIANLMQTRAAWQDDDNGFRGTYPIAPSITVESTPLLKFQRYWIVDRLSADQHQAVMRRLVQDYGCDDKARDLVRVLRLPGFFHCKNRAAPHMVRLIEATGQVYSSDEIVAAFPPIWPKAPHKPARFDRRRFEESDFVRLVEALSFVPADDRDVWFRVGCALKLEFGEGARALWDGWSATSSKFEERTQERTWRSICRSSGVTLRTVFHYARQHGHRGGCYA